MEKKNRKTDRIWWHTKHEKVNQSYLKVKYYVDIMDIKSHTKKATNIQGCIYVCCYKIVPNSFIKHFKKHRNITCV